MIALSHGLTQPSVLGKNMQGHILASWVGHHWLKRPVFQQSTSPAVSSGKLAWVSLYEQHPALDVEILLLRPSALPQLLPHELPCSVKVNQKVTTHHCDIVETNKWAHNIAREIKVLKSRSSIVYITKREEKCVELKRFSDILISLVAMKFTVQWSHHVTNIVWNWYKEVPNNRYACFFWLEISNQVSNKSIWSDWT